MGAFCTILSCVYLEGFIIQFFRSLDLKKGMPSIHVINKDHHDILMGKNKSVYIEKKGISISSCLGCGQQEMSCFM